MVEVKVLKGENSHLNFRNFKSKDEYFIYLFFQNHLDEAPIQIKSFCDMFAMDMGHVKEIISELKKRGILKFNTIAKEGSIQLNIEFENQENETFTMPIEELLSETYYFSPEIIRTIVEQLKLRNKFSVEHLKPIVLNILNKRNLKVKFDGYQINSPEDTIYFLKNFAPHEIFGSWNIDMTNADKIFVFENIFENHIPKEVVNLVIDYTIKTNMYHSFNSDFAQKNLNMWQNNKLETVEDTLEFIRMQKEKVHEKKMQGNYEEPIWEKVNSSDDDIVSIDELEKLLNE